jgi:hypothetical protein
MLSWQVILILMLLGHLVADYTLQGWLADGKQKKWWQKLVPNGELPRKYKYDYVAALVCHALSWSIFICAPFYASEYFLWAILANTVVHAIVDDLKANRGVLNLIQDQLLHLIQILVTFFILI